VPRVVVPCAPGVAAPRVPAFPAASSTVEIFPHGRVCTGLRGTLVGVAMGARVLQAGLGICALLDPATGTGCQLGLCVTSGSGVMGSQAPCSVQRRRGSVAVDPVAMVALAADCPRVLFATHVLGAPVRRDLKC